MNDHDGRYDKRTTMTLFRLRSNPPGGFSVLLYPVNLINSHELETISLAFRDFAQTAE
jgi:hypothetical protein